MTLIGSLCSGYGGLDLAVEALLDDAHTVWFSEYEPHAASVFEAHWPNRPNLGDITAVDWNDVQPVDILTAGYPCQPFSHAGQRKGTDDARHLWPHISRAVSALRPGLVVLENVAGHLSLGGPAVVGDLARLGYDARWVVVRAADVGACHRRARWFCIATDANSDVRWRHRREISGTQEPIDGRLHLRPGDGSGSTTDAEAGANTNGGRLQERAQLDSDTSQDPADWHPRGRHVDRLGNATPVALLPTPKAHDAKGPNGSSRNEVDLATALLPTPRVSNANGAGKHGNGGPDLRTEIANWGAYGAAIARHADVLGRPAPAPTDDKGRLSPRFVEWMQMLPDGWVTDVVPTRTAALKILGNGVVWPQALHALRHLCQPTKETP